MKKIYTIIILAMAVGLSSCAAIFQGTTKRVVVRSTTPETKIYIDGDYKGTDMADFKLRRRNSHTIVGKKKGYETQTIFINRRTQGGWIAFDILFNWLGLITDAILGSWYTFDKDNVTLSLEKKENPVIQMQQAPANTGVTPVIINNKN